jgi:hypothetical protein
MLCDNEEKQVFVRTLVLRYYEWKPALPPANVPPYYSLISLMVRNLLSCLCMTNKEDERHCKKQRRRHGQSYCVVGASCSMHDDMSMSRHDRELWVELLFGKSVAASIHWI